MTEGEYQFNRKIWHKYHQLMRCGYYDADEAWTIARCMIHKDYQAQAFQGPLKIVDGKLVWQDPE